MSVTIKDVAKLAGVSPSTVSRTCSNHPAISEKTKLKVKKAMMELGYEPNFQASNLAGKSSKTIGLILPIQENDIYENSFFLEVIHGICQYCNKYKYMNTIISENSEEKMITFIDSIVKAGKVDGFILLYSKVKDPVVEYLNSHSLSYVMIGKPSSNINSTIYIDNDNITAGKDATDYLINLGHKKIAFVCDRENRIFIQDRQTGYISSLIGNNLPYEERWCIYKDLNNERDIEEIKKIFTSKNAPTAIVAIDDIVALTLEKIFNDIGVKVPEDISIISFNNSLLSKLTKPQLTCVDINNYQLGEESAAQIIKYVQNREMVATKIIVPHTIIERESCKAIEK